MNGHLKDHELHQPIKRQDLFVLLQTIKVVSPEQPDLLNTVLSVVESLC